MTTPKTNLSSSAQALLLHRQFPHNIRTKTLTCLGAYSLFLILTLSGTVYFIHEGLRKMNESAQAFETLTDSVETIHESFIRQAQDRKNIFLRGTNPQDFQTYRNRIMGMTAQIQNQVQALLANPDAQPYHAQLRIFLSQHQQLMQTYDQGMQRLLETQDPMVGDQYVRDKGRFADATLTQVLQAIKVDQQQRLMAKQQQMQQFLLLSMGGLILLILTGSGALILVITDPIRRIIQFTQFLEASPPSPIHAELTPQPDHNQIAPVLDDLYRPLQGERLDEISYMITAYSTLAQRIRTYNQQLQNRDSLLNCVNAATQCLVAHDDLDTALPQMLKILGEGTQQCRAYILQISRATPTDDGTFHLTLEWDAPEIPPKSETGGQFPVPISAFPTQLTAPLKAGKATQFLARDLDGISPAERMPGQARSLVGVPIMVAGEWWGLLGLDDCLAERVWSEAEIVVLATAATAVGNAIERDLARKAREAAERKALLDRERAERADQLEVANQVLSTRDRWLDTTAIAAKQLLSSTEINESVPAALQILGENLACDRIGIMVHQPSPTDLGSFRLLYEWATASSPRQMTIDDLITIPASDFADWAELLIAGEAAGGGIDTLTEPLRSKMQALGILYTYAVPILMGTDFWGLMFIDYCREARQLTPPELAVFKTAATCVGSAIYQDHVRRDQTEQEQAKQQADLVNALTDERNRLAREIHDTLAQAFTGISLQLEAVRSLTAPSTTDKARLEQAHTYVLRARDLARRGLFEARHSVRALRADALETDALPDALRKALERTQRDTSLTTHFHLEGDIISLPDELQLNLLRIAQEAITNILRHANATQLDLTLHYSPKHIRLCIADDGNGFDPATLPNQGSYGLIGIRERATRFYGCFELHSTPTIGTTLKVTIPLPK